MHGATMPFAPTQSTRAQSGDPRRSLEERYASQEVYVELFTKCSVSQLASRLRELANQWIGEKTVSQP
jgi:hypothetical protein